MWKKGAAVGLSRKCKIIRGRRAKRGPRVAAGSTRKGFQAIEVAQLWNGNHPTSRWGIIL